MERLSRLARVYRALRKAPASRSVLDIGLLMEATAHVPLFAFRGEAIHRDLCHVMTVRTMSEGETRSLATDCEFSCVLAGCVNVKTRDLAPFVDARRRAALGGGLWGQRPPPRGRQGQDLVRGRRPRRQGTATARRRWPGGRRR